MKNGQNKTNPLASNSSGVKIPTNKTVTTHQKASSNAEYNWGPTTMKPNPLGLKLTQQRSAHVLNVSQITSANRESSSHGEREVGQSQSPLKTLSRPVYTSIPATTRNIDPYKFRKVSEGAQESHSHARSGSASRITSTNFKQKSLSEISRIEGFIEDQKSKIEQAQHEMKVKAIKAHQSKMMSESNIINKNKQGIIKKGQSDDDDDNNIKSLTDLNEIEEMNEGIETPVNPRKGTQNKPHDGFGEQNELVKMINRLEVNRNQNRTLDEIKQIEEKKEQLRLMREKQLRDLMNATIHPNEKSFKITFEKDEVNFRTILKEKFSKEKYSYMDITFEGDQAHLTDYVLFEQQNDSLKQLILNFTNATNFNDETLGAIKYIKLIHLQNLVLNLARTKTTKQLINYNLFNLSYIPRVEINFTPNDKLVYYREDLYIPIDYSNYQIKITDLQKLSQCLTDFKTTHLRLVLNDNVYLSTSTESVTITRSPNKRRTQVRRQSALYQQPFQPKPFIPISKITSISNDKILYELGHALAKVKNLKISFKNCNLLEADFHNFIQGLLETNSTSGDQSVFGNNYLETIEINFEGNHPIQESLFQLFKQQNFKKLQSFILIFDKKNQIIKQYEQFNAFHFIQYLKHIDIVKFITNSDQVIYYQHLTFNMINLSISYLDISPFQLVDIQKALNTFKHNIIDLTLDLSNSYKLPYKILKSFLNEISCLKNTVKRFNLNLTNTNISEIEYICLYMTVNHVLNLTVKYDIELSNLFRVTDSYSKLFLHQLGETILDKDLFRSKFNFLMNQLQQNPYLFTNSTINFYYNYALTPEVFEEGFKPFLQRHYELTSLHLDFNYCCYEPDQILAMMNTVITGLQSNKSKTKQFEKIHLSFLNNHQLSLEQLIVIMKKFLKELPKINHLILVTDQYTIEKLEKKPDVCGNLNAHPILLKINKLEDIKLEAKKLYVAKKIAPEKFQESPNKEEDEYASDDDIITQILLPKIFDLNIPARVKKVISTVTKNAALITYDHENPQISIVSIQKNIKDLAKSFPYDQVFVLHDANAVELEELYTTTKTPKK